MNILDLLRQRANYIRYFIVVCVGIILTVLSFISLANEEAQKDTKRYPLSKMFLIASIVGTFFTLLYFLFRILMLKLNRSVIIFYMLGFCLAPFLIALIHFAIGGFDFQSLVFEIGFGICFAWVILMKLISPYQQPDSGKLFKYLGIPIFCCCTFPILLFGIPLFIILNTQNINIEDIFKIFDIGTSLIAIVVFFTSTGYYLKYFLPKNEDQEEFNKLSIKTLSILEKKPKINYLPGIIIFLLFLAVYLFCLINLNHCVKNLNFSKEFYLNLIYLILTPLTMFCGITISRIQWSFVLKLNFFTVIFALIPILTFLILYLKFPEYQQILQYFVALPLFFTIFWSFISSIESKILYSWVLSLSCMLVAFPLGFLLPFSLFGTLNQISVYILMSISLFIFISILAISAVMKINSFCSKTKYEKLEILSKTTLTKTSLFLITMIFITSEGTLLYMYFTAPFASPSTGAILSMLGMIFVLYITTSLTIQVNLKGDLPLVQKLSIGTVLFFSFSSIITGILYSTLGFLGSEISIACLSSCISSLIIMILTLGFFQLKYQNQRFGQLLIVISNLILWVFLVLPLAICLPSALSRAKDSKSRNKIIGVATIFIGVVFMIGVSLVSILYNLYQKKMQKERKAIECCKQIQGMLLQNKIRCEFITVRKFYDKYLGSKNTIIDAKWEEIFKLENYSGVKYKKIFFCSDSKSDAEDSDKNKNKNEGLTIWKIMGCFDKGKYQEEKKDGFQLEIEENEVNEVNVTDKIEIVSDEDNRESEKSEELDFYIDSSESSSVEEIFLIKPRKMISNDFHHMNVLNICEEHSQIMKFSRYYCKKSTTIRYECARRDWLGFLFDTLASDPDDKYSEHYLSLQALGLLLRFGGINEGIFSNKLLRYIFYNLTGRPSQRPLNKDIFVDEAFPIIAEYLFPNQSKDIRENLMINNYLLKHLMNNFKEMKAQIEIYKIKVKKKYPSVKNSSKSEKSTPNSQLDYQEIDLEKGDHSLVQTSRSIKFKTIFDGDRTIPSNNREEKQTIPYQKYPKYCTSRHTFYTWFIESYKKFDIVSGCKCISMKLQDFLNGKFALTQENKPQDPQNNEESDLDHIDKVKTKIKERIDDFSKKEEHQVVQQVNLEPNLNQGQQLQNERENLEGGQPKNQKITLSKTDYMSILIKVMEVLQLSSIGLKKEISWTLMSEPLAKSSNSFLIENNPYFIHTFWLCFGVAMIYVPIALLMKNAILSSQLNNDETLSSKFKKFIIQIAGSLLYMFIIKSQLSVFSCNINSDPPVLWHTDIVCYESFHIIHFFFAIFCLIIYYPLATFIYPILQFSKSELQIRFDTTFLIILSQIKLCIAAITVFLPYQYYLKIQLIIASFALLFLCGYCYKVKPCITEYFQRKVTIWMTAGYFIAFFCNFMGLLNLWFGGSLIINIIFLSSIGIILIFTILWHILTNKKNRIYVMPNNPLGKSSIENLSDGSNNIDD